MKRKIDFDEVLKTIEKEFSMIEQWAEDADYFYASAYTNNATALIELLEVNVCGSTGGFDKGQKDYESHANEYDYVPKRLWNRYCWLSEKYGQNRHWIK